MTAYVVEVGGIPQWLFAGWRTRESSSCTEQGAGNFRTRDGNAMPVRGEGWELPGGDIGGSKSKRPRNSESDISEK